MRKLVAGNWKMNGLRHDLSEISRLITTHPAPKCDVLICPPVTLMAQMAALAKGSALMIGGQDCHPIPSGAHTGDISAAMLVDAGASHVILGHSERRQDHLETSALVQKKASAALCAGLKTIICVGETQKQRDMGQTLDVIDEQLINSVPENIPARQLIIAYEPVWAIGTGLTPSLDDIANIHRHLREKLHMITGDGFKSVPLLYGGSVKPANASDIFKLPDVNGALVGGASLNAHDFGAIINCI